MSNSTEDLTDKQVIQQLIKEDKTLGFRLADPDFQNELVVRFMSFYNANFRDLVYDGKLLKALLQCHPVEGIVRTASEIAKARTNGLVNVEKMTKYQRDILQVIEGMEGQFFGLDVYKESSWLCFNVWMTESVAIKAFMEQAPYRIYQVRAFNAISVSRLRRFLVEDGYGSKSAPLLQ